MGLFRYPQKSIGRNDDYLEIGVIEYVPPKPQSAGRNISIVSGTSLNSSQKAIHTIQLPMPGNISDANQVTWGEDSLSSLAAYGAEQVTNILKSQNLGSGIMGMVSNVTQTGREVLERGGAQGGIESVLASKLVNVLGANTTPQGLLSRATGQIVNPNLELLFQGVNLRSFAFDFDLAPRDQKESEVVKQIIRIFKQSMAPKIGELGPGSGLFVKAPDVFLLKYKSGSADHPFLNKFKPCALVNMGTNYTGSGSYSTYADKTPVHMKLNVSFTELNPIYYEDYKNVGGVGY
jgi:hypothetical protein